MNATGRERIETVAQIVVPRGEPVTLETATDDELRIFRDSAQVEERRAELHLAQAQRSIFAIRSFAELVEREMIRRGIA